MSKAADFRSLQKRGALLLAFAFAPFFTELLFFTQLLFFTELNASAAPEQSDTADDGVPSINLGHEYTEYNKSGQQGAAVHRAEHGALVKTLLFIPNRLMDLFEIFRFDVGVGPAAGAVVRLTKWGQIGYRSVNPFSLRAGLTGRHSPVFLESSSEFGVGPMYVNSHDRFVEPVELGAGLDFFIIGVYVGLDFGAIPDFFAGLAGYDPSEDDF